MAIGPPRPPPLHRDGLSLQALRLAFSLPPWERPRSLLERANQVRPDSRKAWLHLERDRLPVAALIHIEHAGTAGSLGCLGAQPQQLGQGRLRL